MKEQCTDKQEERNKEGINVQGKKVLHPHFNEYLFYIHRIWYILF